METQQSTPTPAPTRRLTLADVVGGRLKRPPRVVMHGTEGVGKTSFAADAPSPVFICSEDGTWSLDVKRISPATWAELLDVVRQLETEPHDFKTLVIDTVDWAEPLLWKAICERDGKTDIEDYGYGKGYVAALGEWRVFVGALERVRERRGMAVILLAHSTIKQFKNPQGEDFDRYEMKLDKRASGLLKEWCDYVLFANYETFAHKDEKTKRVRGVDSGARLIYTSRTAAYDAKNRSHNPMPGSIPLSWADFMAAIEPPDPAQLETMRAEIERKAQSLDAAKKKKTLEALARNHADAAKLAKLNVWLNGELGLANKEA